MAMRYYISTEEASFFINNRMGYANSIPTSGNYKVGDFIISSTQEDGIFGWVCTVAGTPGEWEVIGSGMSNSGSVMHDKVVGYINSVSFSDTRSSIEIGINEYEKGKDFLEVHYNGLMLAEGVHYNVSEDGKSIIALDEVWNENADDTQQMIFRVIKSEGVNVKELKNTINIDSACYEVEMGIEGYSPERDVVEVHLNGVLLVQGVDYEIVEGRISKKDRSEAWNPYNVNGQKMFVRVFRNIANLVEPSDGSVTVEKLAPELASDIAAIDGLVTTVGMQNNTISNLNDRVAAIEEKIESGDIVTNGSGGGPVKLTYKDNLVEVINTNTVVIGLEFDKEKDMLEVHIDGLKLAEGVHYNISEDGTSIVKVEGVWNPDSLEDQYIDFRVITAGNQQIDHLTRNVEFSSPMTEVGIELEYEHGVDILIVHLNGIKLVEGLDFNYVADGNKIVKIDVSEPWNLYGVDGQLFVIDVLSNVGEKVNMNMLADDVKTAIEEASNIDLSGKQDKTDDSLLTESKDLVGAINELFQNANNGKQIIADAVGSPLTIEDSFAAMGEKITNIINNLKNMLENNNINIDSSNNLNDLINKVRGISEFLISTSIPEEVYENTLIIIDESPSDNSNIYLYENNNCQEGDIIINCLSNGETGIKLSSGKLENILCVKSVKKKVGEEFIELQCYYYYKEAYRTLDYEDIVFDKDNQTVHEEWKLANSCAGGYSRISNNQIQVHGACERNSHANDCTATFTSQKFYEYSKLRLKFSTSCSDNVITIQIKDAYTGANIISKTYGSGTFDEVYEANKPFYLYVYSPGSYKTGTPTRIYSTTINIDSISVMKN